MLIDLVGADRVVCGTDFPQGMAIKRPVEYVEAIPNIIEKERQLILCEKPGGAAQAVERYVLFADILPSHARFC
jgi:hypothetical protein